MMIYSHTIPYWRMGTQARKWEQLIAGWNLQQCTYNAVLGKTVEGMAITNEDTPKMEDNLPMLNGLQQTISNNTGPLVLHISCSQDLRSKLRHLLILWDSIHSGCKFLKLQHQLHMLGISKIIPEDTELIGSNCFANYVPTRLPRKSE